MALNDKNDPFVKYTVDIAFAATRPFITSDSLAKRISVSAVAARAHIRALVEAGLLSPLAYQPLGGRGRRTERYRLTSAVRFVLVDRRRGGEVYICTPPDGVIYHAVAKIYADRPESDRERIIMEECLSGIGTPFSLTVLGDVSGVKVPAYHVIQLASFRGDVMTAFALTARIIEQGGKK